MHLKSYLKLKIIIKVQILEEETEIEIMEIIFMVDRDRIIMEIEIKVKTDMVTEAMDTTEVLIEENLEILEKTIRKEREI